MSPKRFIDDLIQGLAVILAVSLAGASAMETSPTTARWDGFHKLDDELTTASCGNVCGNFSLAPQPADCAFSSMENPGETDAANLGTVAPLAVMLLDHQRPSLIGAGFGQYSLPEHGAAWPRVFDRRAAECAVDHSLFAQHVLLQI